MLKKHWFFFTAALIFAIFWISTNSGLDPDFGWHYKMGELIAKSGIPATDPFSYSMSYYPFVDHEWLTNMAIFRLYPNLGLDGLALIAAAISFLAFLLPALFAQKKYVIVPFIFSTLALLPFLGIRPQVQSWL